jgi:GTPase SAR1 family protein
MGNLTGKVRRKVRDQLLILGLDNAGKSSILSYFKLGENVNFEAIEISYGDVLDWVVSFRGKARPLWESNHPFIRAVVLVVDSNDKDYIMDARDLLCTFLFVGDLNEIPMAIALNKRDCSDCMTRDDLVEKLELKKIGRPCEVFLTTTKPTPDVDTENDKLLEWITTNTGKHENESPKSKKVGFISAFIRQPIIKLKNKIFE